MINVFILEVRGGEVGFHVVGMRIEEKTYTLRFAGSLNDGLKLCKHTPCNIKHLEVITLYKQN